MFDIVRQYIMKLNLLKCSFEVSSEKFLGYMVNQWGIEINHEKIQALLNMKSLTNKKQVMSLNGQIAALSHFISRATDSCLSFFNVLRANKKFEWTLECEQTFQSIKEHLEKPPFLSKPLPQEILLLYLSVS